MTGKDGIPGNRVSQPTQPNTFTSSTSAATNNQDGDLINAAYHPLLTYPLPYRWRIIAVQDFQL